MFKSVALLNKSIATISIASLLVSFLICSSITIINVSGTSSHDMRSHTSAMSHSNHAESHTESPQPTSSNNAHIEHFKSLALALIPSFVSVFVQLFAIIFIIFIVSKLGIFIELKSRVFKEESPPFKILKLISKSCSPRSPPVFV